MYTFRKKRLGIWFLLPLIFTTSMLSAQVVAENNIVYAQVLGRNAETIELKLDSYVSTVKSNHKKPVLLLVHGGGFAAGDKQQALYIKMATEFANKGYAVFSINYRLKGKKEPFTQLVLDNAVSDVNAAIKWLLNNRKKYGVNKRKILICGDSAGGGIVVNTAFQKQSPVKFVGCIDLWGGLPGNNLWDAPIDKFIDVQDKTTPVCIIHGTKDPVVPLQTSIDFFEKIRKNNPKTEFHILENAKHYPEERADEFIRIMMSFSDKLVNK